MAFLIGKYFIARLWLQKPKLRQHSGVMLGGGSYEVTLLTQVRIILIGHPWIDATLKNGLKPAKQ
jgi:hypothetical protein